MLILGTSKEYILIGVDAPESAGDITAYACEVALIADDGSEPEEADWVDALWIGGEVALLVGPGGDIEPADGDYMCFIRITAGIEQPVRRSGRVRIGLNGT